MPKPRRNYLPDTTQAAYPQNNFIPIIPSPCMSSDDATDARKPLEGARRSLEEIRERLDRTHDSRERLIRGTRDVVILCSQSIISVHGDDLKTARAKADQAAALLESYRKMAPVSLTGHLVLPEQEMVEALSLLALAEGRPVPSRTRLAVSDEAYVLGLLDCVGELKRMVYDMIRRGKTEEAGQTFAMMEDIYNMLYPLATYDKIIREARRKLDVNRALLESTRAAITEEIRRSALIDTMKGAGDGI